MGEWKRVFAPATVANVGPGYDCMGFALEQPGDVVQARLTAGGRVEIRDIRYADPRDAHRLPTKADQNTAGVAANRVVQILHDRKALDADTGVELMLEKNLPLGSGMGSSGASAVAAAWAVNRLAGEPLPKDDDALLLACIEAEAARSGFHADNVAPALLGGFVLIRSYAPLDVVRLDAPDDLICVLVMPDYELPTRKARAAVPREVSFETMVKPQCANAAGLIAGLWQQDVALFGRSIEDRIVEPARAPLIPGFEAVKAAALQHGAFGCSISGAGPSVFAVTNNFDQGHRIGGAMANAFAQHGLRRSAIYVSRVNREGAKEIE